MMYFFLFKIILLQLFLYLKKGRQVWVPLLYIGCRLGHYYGCAKFEFNDIPLTHCIYEKRFLSETSYILQISLISIRTFSF